MFKIVSKKLWVYCTLFLVLSNCLSGFSQIKLSLKDLPSMVESGLPLLNAGKANAEATKSVIEFEKRSLMPNLSVAYQANLATFNNITGMSYPGLIMPISGPPSSNNDINFIPGSAATVFLNWQPITFGQRNAAIDRATSQYKLANASYSEQTFRHQYMAINAYLDAVYFGQLLKSNKANINRYTRSLEQSLVLAKNGLKPGVDTIQLQSAMAQAEIDFLQNENNYRQKLINLSSLIGRNTRDENLILTDTLLNSNIQASIDTSLSISSHPYYVSVNAHKNLTESQLAEVNKSWRPKLDLWGNVYGRGSGMDAGGRINQSDGFDLNRHNVGIGFQLSFPLLQFYQTDAKKKQYQQLLKAEEFNLNQVELDLNKQADMAFQQYKSNLSILKNTAFRLTSATQAFNSLKISYEAGLVDYTRLVQSQYELQQAEINYSGAQLFLQRSLLDIAVAKGDLNIFFNR